MKTVIVSEPRYFRYGKEIKELRGGVYIVFAQAMPQTDTARAEKSPFRK
ncbi:MAG: hypothetical protein ABFD50_05400 [Smithella sp.]